MNSHLAKCLFPHLPLSYSRKQYFRHTNLVTFLRIDSFIIYFLQQPQVLTKSGAFKSIAKSNKSPAKSAPKLTKMTVKGGGAVDPESGHDHDCHIYKEGTVMYSATLGMVDLIRGSNSYYKLQLLEHDSMKR